MSDLLPCTCGLRPVVHYWNTTEVVGVQIRCPWMGGCGRFTYGLTYVGAKAAWNEDRPNSRTKRAAAYAKGAG